jgi:DNA-binding response OmpR family regulator
MLNILVVEDDDNLSNGIRYALEQEGWSVKTAGTEAEASDFLRSGTYDLILLDVMLPDGNGFDLCEKIRKSSDVPIVFLTAKDEEIDVVMGLDKGGDDYVTKPFRLRELISRIKANARKRSLDHFRQHSQFIRSGRITLDLQQFSAHKDGREILLTPTEFKILREFMENSGIVVTREILLERVWETDGPYIDDNTLSVHIRRLREKLEDNPSEPALIETLRGLGYRWNSESE